MRIAVTGGSGFVGIEVIPLLAERADELVVVGRDINKLHNLFPDLHCISYDKLSETIEGFDLLLCLVTKNNDKAGNLEEFRAVNVTKIVELARIANSASVKRFVHFSTFHLVNSDWPRSNYAASKLEAEIALSKLKGIEVVNLRLPAVYGARFKGKMKFLSSVPHYLKDKLLPWIGALQPIVSAETIAKVVIANDDAPIGPVYVSESSVSLKKYLFIKRCIDLLGAIGTVVCLWWLFPILWLVVKLDSKGPGFLVQERVGKGAVPFNCYKFRTMYSDTEDRATHQVPEGAVTSCGKWMRKYKLDELPQVVNIFQNKMSLVGPRPCLPIQRDLVAYREREGVFDVKPGITGLAQIQGVDMSRPEVLTNMDVGYMHTRGTFTDIKIILATTLGRGLGDKVSASATTSEEFGQVTKRSKRN